MAKTPSAFENNIVLTPAQLKKLIASSPTRQAKASVSPSPNSAPNSVANSAPIATVSNKVGSDSKKTFVDSQPISGKNPAKNAFLERMRFNFKSDEQREKRRMGDVIDGGLLDMLLLKKHNDLIFAYQTSPEQVLQAKENIASDIMPLAAGKVLIFKGQGEIQMAALAALLSDPNAKKIHHLVLNFSFDEKTVWIFSDAIASNKTVRSLSISGRHNLGVDEFTILTAGLKKNKTIARFSFSCREYLKSPEEDKQRKERQGSNYLNADSIAQFVAEILKDNKILQEVSLVHCGDLSDLGTHVLSKVLLGSKPDHSDGRSNLSVLDLTGTNIVLNDGKSQLGYGFYCLLYWNWILNNELIFDLKAPVVDFVKNLIEGYGYAIPDPNASAKTTSDQHKTAVEDKSKGDKEQHKQRKSDVDNNQGPGLENLGLSQEAQLGTLFRALEENGNKETAAALSLPESFSQDYGFNSVTGMSSSPMLRQYRGGAQTKSGVDTGTDTGTKFGADTRFATTVAATAKSAAAASLPAGRPINPSLPPMSGWSLPQDLSREKLLSDYKAATLQHPIAPVPGFPALALVSPPPTSSYVARMNALDSSAEPIAGSSESIHDSSSSSSTTAGGTVEGSSSVLKSKGGSSFSRYSKD